MEGIVDLAGEPEVMEEDGQFAGQGEDGTFLGVLAAARSELEPSAAQITARAKRAKDVLSTANQQAAQIRVAGFGDAKLRTPIA